MGLRGYQLNLGNPLPAFSHNVILQYFQFYIK